MKKSLMVLGIGAMALGCSDEVILEEVPDKGNTQIQEEAETSIESTIDPFEEGFEELEEEIKEEVLLEEQLEEDYMNQLIEEAENSLQ